MEADTFIRHPLYDMINKTDVYQIVYAHLNIELICFYASLEHYTQCILFHYLL